MLQTVQNILRVYHQAGPGELDAGLRWYTQAHDEAFRLHCGTGRKISLPKVCGVIAAVSPGLRWERNVAVAERILSGQGLEGLGVRWYLGVRKAEQILRVSASMEIPHILHGNKTVCFYDNLAFGLQSTRVTIDGHAWAIRQGIRVSLDLTPSISDTQYRQAEEDYRSAAAEVCIAPLQLQAVTWVVWRRLHGVNAAHYLPLFESLTEE
jgi:hypothetical protein